MKKTLSLFIAIISSSILFGQYAPDADTPGTNAIHKDSNVFISWASGCTVERGFLNISNTSFEIDGNNKVSFGSANDATGMVEGDGGSVVSLGDKGYAILTFDHAILNGPGWDFAVFENGFSNTFLELAVVEVSSNGVDFVRFPAYSETPTDVQTNGFGDTDPTKIRNLAGKYKSGYGTPFDLEELTDSSLIDINNITHVKIIDVAGSISAHYGTPDQNGNMINDPFPTPFETGGFDLDGVGVIHNIIGIQKHELTFELYPNPVNDVLNIKTNEQINSINIVNSSGKSHSVKPSTIVDLSYLSKGVYVIRIETEKGVSIQKFIKQ